jgi:alpha-1,2-mannosyltransferase
MPSSRTAGWAPSRARVMTRTTIQVVAVAAVLAAAWYDVFRLLSRPPLHGFFDLRVYRGAVIWWLDGHALYEFQLGDTEYGFTYPPFAAVCMLPLALLPASGAAVLVTVASTAAVGAITYWLVGPVARRHGWSRWFAVALAVPVVLAIEPIRETLGYGQLNMVIFALVVADVVGLRRGRPWAGAGIGLATALKLTPGLFIVLLLLTGRRRPAAVATGTFLGVTLLAFVVNGAASWQYWTETVWQTSRVGRLDKWSNQSVMGMLARLADPGQPDRRLWAVLVGVVLLVGMWRAVLAYRRGDDLVAVTLTGLTACLVSPISWTHHLVWVVPAAVVLVDVAAGTPLHGSAPRWQRIRPRAVAVGAGTVAFAVVVPFVLSVVWHFAHGPGHHHSQGLAGLVGESAYGIVMLALVALLPMRRPAPVDGRDESVVEAGALDETGSGRRDRPQREVQGHLDLADGLLDDQ